MKESCNAVTSGSLSGLIWTCVHVLCSVSACLDGICSIEAEESASTRRVCSEGMSESIALCTLTFKELGAVQAAKASGNLDLEKLMDMKEAGIEVESFVSEEMRLQMYQKEVRTQSTPYHTQQGFDLHGQLLVCKISLSAINSCCLVMPDGGLSHVQCVRSM